MIESDDDDYSWIKVVDYWGREKELLGGGRMEKMQRMW